MRNKYIEAFENAQIASKNIPDFRAGDTLRVATRIHEGDKTRIQNFEGICIARRGSGTGETFIIRKIGANSVGVERIFPIFSDSILEKVVLEELNYSIYVIFVVKLLRSANLENNLTICPEVYSGLFNFFKSNFYFFLNIFIFFNINKNLFIFIVFATRL